MTLVVRELDTRDIDEASVMVARLKLLNEELDPNYKVVDNIDDVARQFLKQVIEDDDYIGLVAVDSETGALAGLIILRLVDRVFYTPRIKALITDLYVKPIYRRKRVATLLIEKAMSKARERGAGLIAAVFPSGNAIALHFYENLGFRPFQTEYYKPL